LANEFCRQVQANHENSPLPEPGLLTIGKNRFRKRHPFWFLSDPMAETPSVSMRDLRGEFRSSIGTPYYRLQHRRDSFDQVATVVPENSTRY